MADYKNLTTGNILSPTKEQEHLYEDNKNFEKIDLAKIKKEQEAAEAKAKAVAEAEAKAKAAAEAEAEAKAKADAEAAKK